MKNANELAVGLAKHAAKKALRRDANRTMKRIFFALFTIIFLFLCGCQTVPDTQSVVNKNTDLYNSAFFATQPEHETTPSHVRYTKAFDSTDGSVQFQIDIDQELFSTKIPVIQVKPREISSKDIQRVAQSLLGDAIFYEREPSSNPQYSKAQYQEMIARLSPYANMDAMTNLVGNGNAEDMLTSVKSTIAWITEQMETAPDENPHKPCDWTLKKERVYNDAEWDIGQRPLSEDNDWLVATAEKDGLGYKYMVVSRNQDDYKLNRFSIQLGGASADTYVDRLIYWSELCRTDAPAQSQIDLVESKVMDMLGQMDLGQWRIADTQTEIYGTEADPEYMLRIRAVPVFHDIPVVSGQKNVSKADDFTGAYVLTDAQFLMSANGDLIEMQLNSPLDTETIVNENVAIMSVSELMERMEQHLSLSDAANYGMTTQQLPENTLCSVQILEIECGLARIMAPDRTDIYYYVPALMLRANIEYRNKDSEAVYYSYTNNSFLCVNAIDGSIIE